MKLQSINRYEAYKLSAIGEIETIPEHWNIRRIKEIGSITYGLSQPPRYLEQGLPLIRATNIERGKIVEKGLVFISPDDVPYERNPVLRTNDIVVVRSGAYTADSAIVPELYDGAIAGFDMVLRPFQIEAKYLAYTLLSNYVLRDQLILSSFRAAQPHLNKEELGTTLIFYPPLLEQTAITAYLDTKTAQIDRQIDLLSKKAAQYGKLKQSLINETVTRGLDKTVPMKYSGVEWIGEVPEHWEVKRVKEISTVFNGATPKSSVAENWDGELPWVTTDDLGKLNTKFITDTKRKITAKGYASCGATICPIGSVVISGRAPIGHIGILSIKASSNQGCKTLVLNHRVVSNLFVFYSLLSSKSKLEALGRGTTFIELSTKELGLFNLPMPPLAEQQAIANYLDEKTAHIDRIVATINSQIDKLKELRLTLINDIVTGKIKITNEVV